MQPTTDSSVAHVLQTPAIVPEDALVDTPAVEQEAIEEMVPGDQVPESPTVPLAPQEPGGLLQDLERRQDEVLEQLDELDAKLREVLIGLGATLDEDAA